MLCNVEMFFSLLIKLCVDFFFPLCMVRPVFVPVVQFCLD